MKGPHPIGEQKVPLLNSRIAFKISAITRDIDHYEKHLRRFLQHISLEALQWINFNHDKIIFKTIFV